MKRLLCLSLLTAFFCTGCGMMTEDLGDTPEPAAAVLEAPQETTTDLTLRPEPVEDTPPENGAPVDFNAISDEEALERLFSTKGNADYIPGYCAPADAFGLYLSPQGSDPLEALQQSAPNVQMELLEDSAFYAAGSFPALDEAVQVVPKLLQKDDNDWMWYTGAMEEAPVLATFDLLTHDQKLLYRWYRDDPEIKVLCYDYIAVKDNGDGTAELGYYCYLIDRERHDAFPEWNLARTISLQGREPEAPAQEVVYDIELTLDKQELLLGGNETDVVVRAVPPAEFAPEGISLIDEQTGADALWLVDDNDEKAHGDDIQGDGWYCNRFYPETDFGLDPDVSETKTYDFYAQFEQDGVLHRSETVTLTVYEPFTEAELSDMAHVDEAVQGMLSADLWKQAGTDLRREMAVRVLKDLAKNGYVPEDSIIPDEDVVSFRYNCGAAGSILLTEFDQRTN